MWLCNDCWVACWEQKLADLVVCSQVAFDRLPGLSVNSNLTGRPVFRCRTVARSMLWPAGATSSFAMRSRCGLALQAAL